MRERFYLVHEYLFKRQQLRLLCCFCIFLFSACCSPSFGQSASNEVVVLDFQNETIEKNTEIILDGGWQFYWNALIEPGNFAGHAQSKNKLLDNWTTFKLSEAENLPPLGYATYRIAFSLPKERPQVSLYIPAAYASSKTWINGRLVSEIGRVGTTKTETLHRRFSQILPLNTDETNFEVVIQVANFYHNKGGIDKAPIISTTEHLQNIKSKRVIADMIFIGSLSFIGIFFLLFFLFYWNKDRAVLYFAILCLALGYMSLSDRYAPFAEIFESVSWVLLTKIEYAFLFMAGASASLFFYTIFSSFVPDLYRKIIIYSFISLVGLMVILPAPYFTKLVFPFLILLAINLLYVLFIIIKAITSKRHESILLLMSTLLASFIFYAHIYIFLGANGNAIIYVNFGYILVFLLLSMLLMTRFSNSFRELEKAKVLALEQKREISEKSKELSNVNSELKENLRQLKAYNAELNSFNHIVSHDLKAPLVAMHSLVSFIEEDLEIPINKEANNHFDALKGRISKMYALINGLLEYSKIAQGKKSKETFSFNDLLREIINIVDPEKKHTIHLPEKDNELHTSKIELEHVFLNLINNAIKHCDKEKVIIHISFSKTSYKYMFSIRDNGPGIDSKYHAKIFEMFYQLNETKESEGTGIGLTIVKKIVSGNYGAISIDSKEKIGTTITFSWKI